MEVNLVAQIAEEEEEEVEAQLLIAIIHTKSAPFLQDNLAI